MIAQLGIPKFHPVHLIGISHGSCPLVQLNDDPHDLVEQYTVSLEGHLVTGRASLLVIFIYWIVLVTLDEDFIEFRVGHGAD